MEPPIPAIPALDAEGEDLRASHVDAGDLRCGLVVSDRHQGATHAGADQVGDQHEHHHRDAQEHEVLELIGLEAVEGRRPAHRSLPERVEARLRRLARSHLAASRHLLAGQRLATAATGQAGELLEHQREERRHRQGDQRQVQALDPQRRQADDHTHQEADDHGGRHREQHRPAGVGDEDGRRVGPDAVEGAVTHRDLAVVAGEQVEARPRRRRWRSTGRTAPPGTGGELEAAG